MSSNTALPDYFTDLSLLNNPYDLIAEFRERGRVYYDASRDLYYITGYAETIEILRNSEDFASVIAASGISPLPFQPEGDDISEQIEAHRPSFLGSEMVAAYDGDRHLALRGLIARIFTPAKLKANEEFMAKLAASMLTELISKGEAEVISDLSTPYVTLVVADLLGVPAEDMDIFRDCIDDAPPPFDMNTVAANLTPQPSPFMVTMGTYFYNYVVERRANPKDDIITELSQATFPDGSTPDDIELVKTLMFLFGAGQDTTAKLLGNAIRYLAEHPEMQSILREDQTLIKPFIEEMLRSEGSVKATFRLAKRNANVGGVEIPAGKRVVVFLAGANRDPVRWDNPDLFNINREQLMRHVAFGQGHHTCIGAPLARTEVRVILEELLKRTSSITVSQAHHGAPESQHIQYEPSYVIRGLSELHVNFTPA